MPESPAIGRALTETLRRKLDGELSGRDEELQAALELARERAMSLPQHGRAIELELPGARVAFSTRRGGVSEGAYESLNLGVLTDDEPGRVARNRALLAERPRSGPARDRDGLAGARHGDRATGRRRRARGRDGYAAPGAELRKVDGHVTDRSGCSACWCWWPTACRWRSRRRAGWPCCTAAGAAWPAEIVARALARFDEPPAAAVGPGIGRCCYEVGPEVLDAFSDLDGVA